MSNLMALANVFGPGAKAGVESVQEGGPGSGPRPGGGGGLAAGGEDSHRGARVYSSGAKAYRALTPTGHNIGPFKTADLLKSHLDKFGDDFGLRKEADSATTQIAQLKPSKKKKEADSKLSVACEFRESEHASFKNHKFEVVIIKEGLGNFKDRFFYSKNALQNAAQSKLFEGSQCFADHPSLMEEEIRPERSTRDILGYYENVRYQENDTGQGLLTADLVVADNISLDWAMSLLTNSIEYSKKFKEADLVGLSINASGAASATSIDEFIQSQKFSHEVLKKLVEAKDQGISEINVVNELKEAQSVDLVTKAGAGGRILQMLEQEKKFMKKKSLRESEGMEKKVENEDGAPAKSDGATPPKADGAATPDHADAEQDKNLFAQMIKQYLGKDDASPEEMEAAEMTHSAAKEMGMEGDEAYQAAGNHLKMAMAVGQKMAQKQSEKSEAETTEAEGESKKESETEAETKEGQAPPPNPSSTDGKKKESMTVIELSGEIAKLRESLKKFELRDYLDSKLAESGKSNMVTKKFREALGAPKSKEQIDQSFSIFMKAYEAGTEEVSVVSSDAFFFEKNTAREAAPTQKSLSDMADCLRG